MKKQLETDARDAKRLVQCLARGTRSKVYIPSEEDNAVKEFIRLRDDRRTALKKLEPQTNALCLRNGHQFPPSGRSPT